jgi:hypothetical protein
MANFFDIAGNWNKALQREVEASNARQAELEANLDEVLRPLIDEAHRLATSEFPAGTLWEGSKSFKRDAYVTHVGDAYASLYSGDYYTSVTGTDDIQTVPTFTVKVCFQSVPSPKKGSVIDDFAVLRYCIGKDGRLVRWSGPGIFGSVVDELRKGLLRSPWSAPSVGNEVRDFSEDWS